MTLFQFDDRLAPIRTGRYAAPIEALVWLIALAATAFHPGGLVAAGVLFGLSATSVSRAVASAASFGIVVLGAGWLWLLAVDVFPVAPPVFVDLPLLVLVATVLVVPPTVAAAVRAVG